MADHARPPVVVADILKSLNLLSIPDYRRSLMK
jgi:hypothetical protein